MLNFYIHLLNLFLLLNLIIFQNNIYFSFIILGIFIIANILYLFVLSNKKTALILFTILQSFIILFLTFSSFKIYIYINHIESIFFGILQINNLMKEFLYLSLIFIFIINIFSIISFIKNIINIKNENFENSFSDKKAYSYIIITTIIIILWISYNILLEKNEERIIKTEVENNFFKEDKEVELAKNYEILYEIYYTNVKNIFEKNSNKIYKLKNCLFKENCEGEIKKENYKNFISVLDSGEKVEEIIESLNKANIRDYIKYYNNLTIDFSEVGTNKVLYLFLNWKEKEALKLLKNINNLYISLLKSDLNSNLSFFYARNWINKNFEIIKFLEKEKLLSRKSKREISNIFQEKFSFDEKLALKENYKAIFRMLKENKNLDFFRKTIFLEEKNLEKIIYNLYQKNLEIEWLWSILMENFNLKDLISSKNSIWLYITIDNLPNINFNYELETLENNRKEILELLK